MKSFLMQKYKKKLLSNNVLRKLFLILKDLPYLCILQWQHDMSYRKNMKFK